MRWTSGALASGEPIGRDERRGQWRLAARSVKPAALLDTRPAWDTPEQLGSAIFEWIGAWNNPRRRHTSIGMLSRVQYRHACSNSLGCSSHRPQRSGMITTPQCLENRVRLRGSTLRPRAVPLRRSVEAPSAVHGRPSVL